MGNEKITVLVSDLIKELLDSGKKIELPSISENYAVFDVTIFNLGTEDEYVRIESILNDWQIEFRRSNGKI